MTSVYHGKTMRARTRSGSIYITLNWTNIRKCYRCEGSGQLHDAAASTPEDIYECPACKGDGQIKPKPHEVFIREGKAGSEKQAYNEALGRVVSLHIQRGGSLQGIINELREISAETSHRMPGQEGFLSTPDSIAKALFKLFIAGPPDESRRMPDRN